MKKKVHFMGIAGSGMNAAAGIAQALGYDVSGCDFVGKPNEYTVALEKAGVPLFWEHSVDDLNGIAILCVTPAVFDLSNTHPEFVEARARGIPIMTWQGFMGKELQQGKKVIAVAGTKGKTTTTALIGTLLEEAALDPTVFVGGKVLNWNQNYRVGEGTYFVCEADEFNHNFLNYHPDIAVITNIEMDHPEYFQSFDDYLNSFVQFVHTIDEHGTLIINTDSDCISLFLEKIAFFKGTVFTYGSNELAEYLLVSVDALTGEVLFESAAGTVSLFMNLLGVHNGLNVIAAYLVGKALQVSDDVLKNSFSSFKGIGRRFELMCDVSGVRIFNDYAHNPMSVKSTLDAAKERFSQSRIWGIFQPHMYSRTKLLMDEYAHSFACADEVIITEIFASREKGKPIADEVNSQMLVDAILKVNRDNGRDQQVRFLLKDEVAAHIGSELKPGDIVVNMGAGDNGTIVEQLCQILTSKSLN